MENQQLNLLDRVYTVLRKRGEETEWITSADNLNLRTGIAFVPCDTFTPVSLLYTMIDHPETLVIDVLFAAKVPEHRRVEVSIILSELNADQTAGAFQLDPNSGYVYYRQSFVLEGMDLTEAQFAQLMKNIETVAVETAEAYSHIMETEYPPSNTKRKHICLIIIFFLFKSLFHQTFKNNPRLYIAPNRKKTIR